MAIEGRGFLYGVIITKGFSMGVLLGMQFKRLGEVYISVNIFAYNWPYC